MKKLNVIVFTSLIAASASSFAMGITAEQGKNFTNLNAEMGKYTSGVYLESSWLKNTQDGIQLGGAGAGYNFELGPVMVNAGAKATYLGSKKGDTGVAFPVGGGISLAVTDSVKIYGEGYSANKSLANSVKNYVEANGGIRWTPVTPLTLNVGYRYAGVDGKDGRPGHTLVEGVYVGGGLIF